MRRILYLLSLILVLLSVGCRSEKSTENFSLVKVGDPMPSVSLLRGSDGSVFDSSQSAGKRIFIYFFIYTCPDCHAVTPSVLKLWEQVGGYDDLEFMCISRGGGNHTLEGSRAYWDKVCAAAGIATESMPELYFDRERAAFSKFATQNVPRFYIIRSDGNIVWESEGNFTAEHLKSLIDNTK